jgi:hypothetical protein
MLAQDCGASNATSFEKSSGGNPDAASHDELQCTPDNDRRPQEPGGVRGGPRNEQHHPRRAYRLLREASAAAAVKADSETPVSASACAPAGQRPARGDFPAILRQIKRAREGKFHPRGGIIEAPAEHVVLLIGEYTGVGATKDEFVAMFAASNIKVVMLGQVEEMA